MKKAKTRFLNIWIIVLFALAAVFSLVGCAAQSLKVNTNELFLDRYAESRLTVKGEKDLTWSSADKSVVTVDNKGLVVAQGTGETVITVSAGLKKSKIRVVVKNSGEKPTLVVKDIEGFVGQTVPLETKISYGEKDYHGTYVYLPEDESVAVYKDGELKGVAVGETVVKVTSAYKGLNLKKEFKLTIYPDSYMQLDDVDYTVVCTDNPLKQSKAVSGKVVRNCKEVENPEFSLQVLEGEEYITTEGNKIIGIANAGITEAKQALVKVTNTQGSDILEKTVEVCVKPSFEQMQNNEFVYNGKYLEYVEYKPYDGTVGGRTGAYRYYVDEGGKGAENAIWSAWGTQIELQSTMTEGGVYKYSELLGAGYRFVSYDVYFTGEKGLSVGKYADAVQAYKDSYLFRNDIFIVKGDKITNTLVADEWLTVFVDLEKILSFGKDCNIFLQNINVCEETFVDNIRYWYDGNALKQCEKEFAFAANDLTEQSDFATAKPDEFISRSNVYTTYEPYQGEISGKTVENVYRYEVLFESNSTLPSYRFDAFTRSKLLPYHDYTGLAYSEGYNYIAFDIFVESGNIALEVYDGLKKMASSTGSTIAENASITNENVFVYTNGKVADGFSLNKWYSVVARIDGRSKECFAISSSTKSVAYITNVKYFKDESFKAYYATSEPFETNLRDLVLFVGDELSYVPAVYYLGALLTDNVTCTTSNSDVAEYVDGALVAKQSGTAYFTVCAEKDGFTLEESFRVDVYPKNALMPNKTEICIYDSSYEYLKNSEELSATAIVQGEVQFEPELIVDYVGNAAEYVRIENNKVIGKKAGVAVVRLSLEGDETLYVDITVTVHGKSVEYSNEEFVVFSKSSSSTYGIETQIIDGVTGAYEYVSDKTWNGRLELKETSASKEANGDAQAARENIAALGYQWVLFDLYQSGAMTLFYPTQSGHCNAGKGIKLSAGVWTNNEFVKIYQNGYAVTKLEYNQWYTVAVNIVGWKNTFTTASVALVCYDTSVCYLNNIRYYVDNSFEADYQIPVSPNFAEVAMTEFSALNSGYVLFGAETTKFNAALGAYRYQATDKSKYEWDNRIVFSTNPKTAVTNGYKYISFDIYVEESNFGANNAGYIYLSAYTSSGSLKTIYLSTAGVGTGTPDLFDPSDYIKLYANGEEVTALQVGGWTTVVVALEQLDNMVFYMGCRFGGEFWLKDVRLYKTQEDYQKDYNN